MARPVGRRSRAEASGLPEWIRPQLTQLVDAAPEGLGWLHEIKFDGYRMHARLDRGAVRLLTAPGSTGRTNIRRFAAAVASLPAAQTYLDGELCGVRPDGITSFSDSEWLVILNLGLDKTKVPYSLRDNPQVL